MIYKAKRSGEQRIFGFSFVINNDKNIELIINGKKNKLVDYFDLEKGNNTIILIVKNNLEDLGNMFNGCESLYNIDGLKYLNIKYCSNFRYMFQVVHLYQV